MLLSYFVILIGTPVVEASTCFIGQELHKEAGGGGPQWVLPYSNDSCDCTSIALGGLNVVSPSMRFAPRVFSQPLVVHGVEGVRKALRVECPDAVTAGSVVTTATKADEAQTTTANPPINGLSCDTSTTAVTTFIPSCNYPFAAFDTSVEKYIKFGVRAEYGALLCLAASNAADQDNLYAIVLEEVEAQRSGIRRCVACDYEITVQSSGDLLDGAVFKYLWLRYRNGSIEIGQQGDDAFMSWQDPTPIRNVRYIGVASAFYGPSIDWSLCTE